jgi:hypothetical protein
MTWSEQPLQYMAFNWQRHTVIKREICNLLLVQEERGFIKITVLK